MKTIISIICLIIIPFYGLTQDSLQTTSEVVDIKTYMIDQHGVKTYYEALFNVQNDNVYRDGSKGERFKNNLIRSVVFCTIGTERIKDEETGDRNTEKSISYHQCISWDKGELISKENKVKVFEAILGTDTSLSLTKDFLLYELLYHDSTENIYILNTASTPTSNGGSVSVFAPGFIETIVFIKNDKLVVFNPLYKSPKRHPNTLEWMKSECSDIPELDQFFEDIETARRTKGARKVHTAKGKCSDNLRELYLNNNYTEL